MKARKISVTRCDYQATTSGSLTDHKEAKHEGKKYPCDSCDYQATERGSLTKHRLSPATPGHPQTCNF